MPFISAFYNGMDRRLWPVHQFSFILGGDDYYFALSKQMLSAMCDIHSVLETDVADFY